MIRTRAPLIGEASHPGPKRKRNRPSRRRAPCLRLFARLQSYHQPDRTCIRRTLTQARPARRAGGVFSAARLDDAGPRSATGGAHRTGYTRPCPRPRARVAPVPAHPGSKARSELCAGGARTARAPARPPTPHTPTALRAALRAVQPWSFDPSRPQAPHGARGCAQGPGVPTGEARHPGPRRPRAPLLRIWSLNDGSACQHLRGGSGGHDTTHRWRRRLHPRDVAERGRRTSVHPRHCQHRLQNVDRRRRNLEVGPGHLGETGDSGHHGGLVP